MSVNFEELYDEFLIFAPPAASAGSVPAVISQGIMAEPHTPSPSAMVIYEQQTTPGNGNGNHQQLQQLQQQQPFYPTTPAINQHHSHNMNNLAPGGYNHPPSHIHHHLPNQQQQPQQQLQQQSLLSQQLASNGNGSQIQTYPGHQQQSQPQQQLQQPAGIVYENNHVYQIRQQPYHANYHLQPAPQQQQVHHQIVPQQHIQRPQQQQIQQQGQQQQWFQPHGHGSLVQPFVPQNMVNSNGPMVDHPQLYPGGLEILWRELPLECQRLIDPQDVPDTARFRGYFTVCELIALKRTLQSRYTPAVHQQLQQQQQQLQLQHQQQIQQQKQQMQAQISNQQQNVAITATAGVPTTTTTTTTNTNLNGIKTSGKITKPKKTPHHAQTMIRVPANQTQQQISATVDHAVRETLISLGQGQGQGQGKGSGENSEKNSTIIENSGKGQEVYSDPPANAVENQGNKSAVKASSEEKDGEKTATTDASSTSLTISNNSTTTATTTSGNDKSSSSALGLPSNLAPNATANPPYRTASLVFKLLQIGNYNFRTFSDNNPNKLRIIFNSQRISYECQLPMVQPPRDSLQPLRKLLMIDVSFDQITMIKFGADKLFMRIEGAPLLTVTYHPSSEPYCGPPPLTPQDINLLEQIDKGQLKLNPYHQLFFLNERLVHLLECQFKEHPRFKHLMENSSNSDKTPI